MVQSGAQRGSCGGVDQICQVDLLQMGLGACFDPVGYQ